MSEVRGNRAYSQERTEREAEGGVVCAVEHFEQMHREAHGVVLLWEARKESKRWVKLKPEDPAVPSVLRGVEGSSDVFMSVNEFNGWRLVRLLRSLRALYVDVDGGARLEEVCEALREKGIPEPSFVVWSGRGLHLYWLLRPIGAHGLPLWQRVQRAVLDALLPLGADPKARDCTRVLRLVGTINSKNGETVRGLVLSGRYWLLYELAHEVLGPCVEEAPASKEEVGRVEQRGKVRDLQAQAALKGRRVSRSLSGSIYERWYLVYQDLLRIARHHGQIPLGHRDEWLFLSGVALSWFTQAEALCAELENAASTFTSGLRASEVAKVSSVLGRRAEAAGRGEKVEWCGRQVDPRYHFRRASLYKLMSPLIEDSLLGQMRAVIPDRLAAERKKARDQDRFQDHNTGQGVRMSNEDKRASARVMRAKGLSLRVIAAELDVSVGTVQRWCERE